MVWLGKRTVYLCDGCQRKVWESASQRSTQRSMDVFTTSVPVWRLQRKVWESTINTLFSNFCDTFHGNFSCVALSLGYFHPIERGRKSQKPATKSQKWSFFLMVPYFHSLWYRCDRRLILSRQSVFRFWNHSLTVEKSEKASVLSTNSPLQNRLKTFLRSLLDPFLSTKCEHYIHTEEKLDQFLTHFRHVVDVISKIGAKDQTCCTLGEPSISTKLGERNKQKGFIYRMKRLSLIESET